MPREAPAELCNDDFMIICGPRAAHWRRYARGRRSESGEKGCCAVAIVEIAGDEDSVPIRIGLTRGAGADTKIVNVKCGVQVQVRMQWDRRPSD
jgi:hypothetical protein